MTFLADDTSQATAPALPPVIAIDGADRFGQGHWSRMAWPAGWGGPCSLTAGRCLTA